MLNKYWNLIFFRIIAVLLFKKEVQQKIQQKNAYFNTFMRKIKISNFKLKPHSNLVFVQ